MAIKHPLIALALAIGVLSLAQAQFRPPFFGGGLFGGRPARPSGPAPFAAGGGRGGGCSPVENYSSPSGRYWVSWRSGCRSFSGHDARSVCQRGGARPLSMANPAKAQEFISLVAQENERYFWTSGQISGGSINWPDGAQPVGSVPFWSQTGGLRRPQPDNREGNEFCLAVLNNFYSDGVKYHDVSCHHTKPIICEF